ncbi:hypothetical protein G4Y79_09165 [Phototrophicus methaneseepsis]|uniref:Uncharacterized protein n=1 Tax=Phototrophicus methaneseepsis TaxID=2710758 RepID=A0A7S8IGA6_9CHLR|nr:hypothetical protein [Phototrophicus methaneseepsis]QPC84526.1 hypothetical protein G4Y79_09165 [Phototrophicus methaneseepsis]
MYEKRKNDARGSQSWTTIAAVLIIVGALFLLFNRTDHAVIVNAGNETIIDTVVGGVTGLVGGIIGLVGALVGGVLALVATIIAGVLGLVGGILGLVFGLIGGVLGLIFVLVPAILIIAGIALLVRATT